jgi:hypothetical protein
MNSAFSRSGIKRRVLVSGDARGVPGSLLPGSHMIPNRQLLMPVWLSI